MVDMLTFYVNVCFVLYMKYYKPYWYTVYLVLFLLEVHNVISSHTAQEFQHKLKCIK